MVYVFMHYIFIFLTTFTKNISYLVMFIKLYLTLLFLIQFLTNYIP